MRVNYLMQDAEEECGMLGGDVRYE
jgi:hypothetical protein